MVGSVNYTLHGPTDCKELLESHDQREKERKEQMTGEGGIAETEILEGVTASENKARPQE